MHPGIKRELRGKHQKRIVEISHELYLDKVDILNPNTAKDILEREDDADFMIHFLQSTEPLKKTFSDYQYNVALERSGRIAKVLTNYMKSIRRAKSVENRELGAAYKKEKIETLKTLPKAYLARKLVEYLPKKDLDKIIRIGLRKEENKRQGATGQEPVE